MRIGARELWDISWARRKLGHGVEQRRLRHEGSKTLLHRWSICSVMFASSVEHRPAAEPVTCGEDVLVLLNDGANILTAINAFRKPARCSIFRTRHRDDDLSNAASSVIEVVTTGI